MSGLNKIWVIGNAGTDPDMRYTPNGNPVTSFSVAVNESYTTTEGEKRENTEWFKVVCWNKLAEICDQYVAKGMQVAVTGRVKSNTWTTPDGEKRFSMDIVAESVTFLGGRSNGKPAEGRDDSDAGDLPW